jgi:mannitol-1-phosphate 5-dehydrogenase
LNHVFVGFGFGPIQSGLFAKEARASGAFSEIVVAEVDAALVAAVRGNGNRYAVNVAWGDRVEAVTVDGVTLLNPNDAADAARLRSVLGRATEIVTSLPSVAFYAKGGDTSVARLIAGGLQAGTGVPAVVYTAENNNQAAELLDRAVGGVSDGGAGLRPVQFLNTVIGKMSQVVAEPGEIARRGFAPVAPGFPRAILVESFNRILVARVRLPGFEPGIRAFEEKDDLLPFEEAKLFGHNAAHTMLGFLGALAGAARLSELRGRDDLLELVRRAFTDEAGAALVARHARLGDPLFTADGFRAYADDLLTRMTNPHLSDTVARAIRDPLRKLGRADRLFGAIRLCLDAGIEPACLSAGAWAGLRVLAELPECPPAPAFAACRGGGVLDGAEIGRLLDAVWGAGGSAAEAARIVGALERSQASGKHQSDYFR